MIKKLLILFLSLVLAVSTSACAKNTTTSVTAEDTDNTTAAADTEKTEKTEKTEESVITTTTDESAAAATTTAAATVPTEVVVSITPPDGWEPVEGSVLPVQYMKGTASFMVVHELYFSSTNLDTVVEEAKGMFSGQFDNVEYIGDPTTITVDGFEARNFIWTCDMSSIAFKYNYTYVKVGESIYSIVLADFTETYDSLSADFDQILTDIKFS